MRERVSPQIKNVVFDMGGVLLRFDGKLFASYYTDNEEDARLIDEALFSSPSWPLLDAGAISEDTMARIAETHLPERLRDTMHAAFASWHERQPVLPEGNDIAVRLHEAGYGCYLLSNAGVRFWHQKDRIPSFPIMDGWVVSAWERIMKPDPTIYQVLCERYGLRPEECLFVDDNADNVRGAEAAGMQGHVYVGGADLEAYLHEQGVDI